jgi:hypothetical protein
MLGKHQHPNTTSHNIESVSGNFGSLHGRQHRLAKELKYSAWRPPKGAYLEDGCHHPERSREVGGVRKASWG